MSSPLRVAVVGVGHLGKIHAKIYAESPRAELVAVVDSDPKRAAAVAEEYGCRVEKDWKELPGQVDVVSVVVPTQHHASVAVELLEAGVACLVEKPLASSVEEAQTILDAAERSGANLTVGHVERFQPGVRRVREMGLRPRFIECHRLSAFSFRSTDIGVVHDLMIHDLDLILDLVGSEVVELDAVGGAILTAREDIASVRLVFANGARANVTASRASLAPMRRFRLFSPDSYVSLDFTKNYGLMVRKGEGWEDARERLQNCDPAELAQLTDSLTEDMMNVIELELQGEERPLQAELDSFLRAVAEGRPPEVTGLDGFRALELADRIRDAIAASRW